VKLPPDDAYALRMALEPLTHKVTDGDCNDIAIASIAISLKRIADATEALAKDQSGEFVDRLARELQTAVKR
jgi:hypothetical protein